MFTIIIPTYKRNNLLRRCLNQLKPDVQTLNSNLYEIIISDDSPEHNAKNLINQYYPTMKWIAGPGKGPAANRNNAVKYAKNDYLVFFDDDCIPNTNILSNYKIAINTFKDINIFEGSIYVDRLRNSLAEEAPVNLKGGYLWSCNFVIRKSIFNQINGFDEKFQNGMEDVDFYTRIKLAKLQVKFIANCSVNHPWRIRNLKNKNHWKNASTFKKSMIQYLEKHPYEKKRLNIKYFLHSCYNICFIEIMQNWKQHKGKGIKISFIRIMENISIIPYLIIKR